MVETLERKVKGKKNRFIAKVDINKFFALFSACYKLFQPIVQSHLVFHMHRWKMICFLACRYFLLYSYLWWSYFLKSLSSWWSLFSVETSINLNNKTIFFSGHNSTQIPALIYKNEGGTKQHLKIAVLNLWLQEAWNMSKSQYGEFFSFKEPFSHYHCRAWLHTKLLLL